MNKKHFKRYISMAACLLVVGGSLFVGSFRDVITHADTVTNSSHQFYIVGTKIIDPDGNVFVPIGANVGSKPNNFDWAGGAAGQSAAAQAWGWNTVRLNVDCTTAESYSRVTAKDGDKVLLADIAKIVNEYTAKKIVVMVECHDVGKNANDAANFWTDMANTYKSNPYVWFNYANEPEWDNSDRWITEQKQWLALIRSTGAENIFVADVMNAGNDAGWSGAKKIYDPTMGPALQAGQCNVLMSLHNYGGMANSQDYVMRPAAYQAYWTKVQQAGMAMIIGEYGMNYQLAFQGQANGTTKVVATDGKSDPAKIAGDAYNHMANGVFASDNYARDYGIGRLMWHATFADGNIIASPAAGITLPSGASSGKPNFYNVLNDAMTGTKAGFTLTQMGQDLWNDGHNKPATTAFSGKYADSNCASAAASALPAPTNPINLQPIGSTASVATPISAQAAQFGVRSHDANPALQAAAIATTTKSSVSSVPAPAASTAASPAAATPTTPTTPAGPASSTATTPTPKTKSVVTKSTKPATLFSVGSRSINTQQVGYYGGGGFSAVLLSLVGFHFVSIWRSRRLYGQIHNHGMVATAPETHLDTATQPLRDHGRPARTLSGSELPHNPGDVIAPHGKSD